MQMEFSEAKQYIKDQLQNYLLSKGLPLRKEFSCLNPNHPDNHPSMGYDKRRNKVHCLSCKADYDTFDLIAIEYGLDKKEAFKKAMEIYNIELPQKENNHPAGPNTDYPAWKEKCCNAISESKYLQSRGISAETISLFPIGYDSSYYVSRLKKKWRAVVFFKPRGTYEVRNTDAGAAKGERFDKPYGKPDIPFNLQAINQSRPVYVTEGIIDALSIVECGGIAIAMSGAKVAALVAVVKAKLEKKEFVPPLIAVFDNDEAGNKATDDFLKEMEPLSVLALDGRGILIGKDSNESLMKDREGFNQNVTGMEQQAKMIDEARRNEYVQSESVFGMLDSIRREIDETEIYSSTGYKNMDEALGGGLFTGLYFVGGMSGIGKTTFCLQLSDQIAEQGHDVIIFSLEMSRVELVGKSVSRLTRNSKYPQDLLHVTTGSIYKSLSDEEKSVIDTAFNEYADRIAKHVFIRESIGGVTVSDIREAVERHISLTGNRPLVLLDYLQILAPTDIRASDKQNVDIAVYALKQVSRDYRVPIIAVSSLNRASYTAPITMAAFKESGAIEFSADGLFGIQYAGMDYRKGEGEKDSKRKERISQLKKDVLEAKKKGEPIPVDVKILKLRKRPERKLSFYLHYKYNAYKEAAGTFEDIEVPNEGIPARKKADGINKGLKVTPMKRVK